MTARRRRILVSHEPFEQKAESLACGSSCAPALSCARPCKHSELYIELHLAWIREAKHLLHRCTGRQTRAPVEDDKRHPPRLHRTCDAVITDQSGVASPSDHCQRDRCRDRGSGVIRDLHLADKLALHG